MIYPGRPNLQMEPTRQTVYAMIVVARQHGHCSWATTLIAVQTPKAAWMRFSPIRLPDQRIFQSARYEMLSSDV
jgi:hypothetical protein